MVCCKTMACILMFWSMIGND
uniref:Uncharacterized protein n=1 Tax=Arundo donax TaxID=35708 RepID=A0A0A9FZL5_ARUDO